MTRKDAKKLLPIMRAYSEGKQVQHFNGKYWEDREYLNFDSEPHRYRIKPELKYRPFNNADECWEEIQKHQPIGWLKITFKDVYEIIYTIYDKCNFKRLFDEYTFADGTPFGIKEEE